MKLKISLYKGLVFILFTFLISCTNNDKKISTLQKDQSETGFGMAKLSLKDSIKIHKIASSIIRIDTLFSETRCAEQLQGFNKPGEMLYDKIIQHCIADRRMVWVIESYYERETGLKIELKFDGDGKLLEILKGTFSE